MKKSKAGNRICRAAALAMAVMAAGTGVLDAYAVSVPVCDETLYVTMAGDGSVTEASVVKSYDLHGANTVTDYGNYEQIKNLTDYGTPQTDGDCVTFAITERPDNDRFYFEGTLDTKDVENGLPWDIGIRYRLNGVETDLEDLEHAAGLVEILVDLVPNRNAEEYYRNNMTLEMSAVVDMDKALSVEAPGAQIQSVGNLKAVLFLLLPGEEQHCEIRIGSNDFTFSGLAFMMEPVTLGQLDDLDELRDAKAEVEDSADAVSDSLTVIMDSLESVKDGLTQTADGLRKLDESRKVISEAKDGIYADSDTALAVLKELTDRGENFPSYIETARHALSDLNRDLNALSGTVGILGSQFDSLGRSVRSMSRDFEDLSDLLRHSRHDIGSFDTVLASLKADLAALQEDRNNLNERLDELKKLLEELRALKQQIEEHGNVIGLTPEQKQRLFGTIGGILGEAQLPAELKLRIMALMESASDALENAGGIELPPDQVQAASTGLEQLIGALEGLLGTAEEKTNLDYLVDDAKWTVEKLEQIVSRVHEDGAPIEDVVADASELTARIGRSAETAKSLTDDTSRITRTVNNYHLTASAALDDAGKLTESALRGTDAMYLLMTDAESTLKEAGEPLDMGAEKTLSGLGDALDDAASGLDKIGVIRNARDTVENLVDDKWDEYTGDKMTLLNVDADAKKVSFTSGENPEPQSIQIVLRTAGTSETEEEAEPEVDEDFHPQGSFLERLFNVLKMIAETVRNLFGGRR